MTGLDTGDLIRDAFEILIVVAIGGMVWSVLSRLRRGQLVVPSCPECGNPASRAYPNCRHCGALQPEDR
jgi:predicted amidophosphoribosyltransferase